MLVQVVLFILGVKEGTRKHLYRLVGGLGKVFKEGMIYERSNKVINQGVQNKRIRL